MKITLFYLFKTINTYTWNDFLVIIIVIFYVTFIHLQDKI